MLETAEAVSVIIGNCAMIILAIGAIWYAIETRRHRKDYTGEM